MTPDEPEPPGTPDADVDPAKSRADLQAQLRSTRKKEQKRKHRWRRRILYALSFIVLLGVVGAGGLYFYADYRFDQIKKVHAKHLIRTAPISEQKPFTMLLVGSDTRQFVSNATQENAFGSGAEEGGQRSDVTMAVRVDPIAKTVTVLSIPRDLWVDIPGDVTDISGMNRINAAFNSGPDLLIQTIEHDLDIPINHYASVDFPGFQGMVDALGGVTMDFPTEVKDQYSGLDVTTTGCQVVGGATALELVRARHLYYTNSEGEWEYDGESDFSRIQRQDAFFRAVLAKINQTGLDPLTINAFLGAAVSNLTIDDTLTKSDLFNLAEDFRGLSSSHLITETLPTTSFVTDGGADVLQEAQPYAENMINAFNAIGTTTPTTTTTTTTHPKAGKATTTTTAPTEAHNLIDVNVLNASTVNGIAHTAAFALSSLGFQIGQIGNASTSLSEDDPSEVLYGPSGAEAAHTLASVLSGPVTLVPDSSLTGQTLSLVIAGSQLGVTTSTSATTTTIPTGPTTTTTTTIPGDVYTNTEPEPWNPSPCTLGQSTQATPTTTAHKAAVKKK